jgi:lysophospholipase L1-like esterase
VTRRWFARYWVTNANGLRDNINYPSAIEPGKRRVSFVGDSFTAAHGVANVEDRFANRLRQEHSEWEVHVLAVPGYETGDELHLLAQLKSTHYQLDLVVLVYCLNDISDLIPSRNVALAQIDAETRHRNWLQRNSYLVDTLRHRLSVRRNPFMRGYFDLVQDAYRGPLWETQQRRLQAFRDQVRARGANLAMIILPFFHALGPRYEYEFVHHQLSEFCRQQGLPCLDLLPLYRGFPAAKLTVNPYDAHPNELAHQLAAPVIGSFVAGLLASNPPPRTADAP